MKEVKIDESPELVRDLDTKAVLNSSTTAYEMYKQRREKQKSQLNLAGDVADLKQEMSELKQLLQEIAQRVK